MNFSSPLRSGVGEPLPSSSPWVWMTASDLLPPKTVRSSIPTARLSGFFASGLLAKATSPLADNEATRWITSVVWKVGMLAKASIAGVSVPAVPKMLIGTQPPVVTVQLVVFSERRACCTFEKLKPLPVVEICSERPDW